MVLECRKIGNGVSLGNKKANKKTPQQLFCKNRITERGRVGSNCKVEPKARQFIHNSQPHLYS